MAVGIGAAGSVGVAHEATPGTYAAPTQFIPVRSESLNFMNEVQYTRPIMGTPDAIHAIEGPQHVEGDIEFEIIPDMFAFLLYGARMTVSKSGAGPYVYTFSPSPAGEAPNKTLSITVVRNDVVFGYTGCVIGSLEVTVDNGVAVATFGVHGRTEATQSAPTPTWPTAEPFAADDYTLSVGGAGVTDADNFTWTLEDNAESVYRLGSAQSAAYVKFGERSVTASLERDFQNKTDYASFQAVTAQRLQFEMDKDANTYVHLDTKLATKSSYEVNLSSQGDLVRASIEYEAKYDFSSSKVYEIVVGTSLSIT